MVTNKKNNDAVDAGTADEDVVFEDAADAGRSALEKAKKALKVCEKERKEYLDGWKRAKADALNEKKRQKDFLERERGVVLAKCALTMLPVYDSIRAALGQSDGATKTGDSGIDILHTQCLRSFADLGIAIIAAVGESFDPLRHQSVGEREVSNKKDDNTVVEVMRVGAVIGDVVIRPAMVCVGIYQKGVEKSG